MMDPITAALAIGNKLIDHFFPDATKAAEAKLELLKMQQSGDLAVMTSQMDINKIEAGSSNLFVSGWRPFIGWGCGFAFLYVALFEPIIRFIATVGFKYAGIYPTLDNTITMQVLLGLLGLAGMRSWEKTQGVTK